MAAASHSVKAAYSLFDMASIGSSRSGSYESIQDVPFDSTSDKPCSFARTWYNISTTSNPRKMISEKRPYKPNLNVFSTSCQVGYRMKKQECFWWTLWHPFKYVIEQSSINRKPFEYHMDFFLIRIGETYQKILQKCWQTLNTYIERINFS